MNPQIQELTAKISLRLENDPHLAPFALKARFYENGIVQIQGIVDVLEEKIQAEELIWHIPGVKNWKTTSRFVLTVSLTILMSLWK